MTPFYRLLLAATISLAAAPASQAGLDTLRRSPSDLHFDTLPTRWDEAIPLGNARLGALVWQHDSALRLSLDRIDLWDLRPMDSLAGPNYRFKWVKEMLDAGRYEEVQRKFDHPYNAEPAPSKIPGAALEIAMPGGAKPRGELVLGDALAIVDWPDGARMQTFVHATRPVGLLRFTSVPAGVRPAVVPPRYAKAQAKTDVVYEGSDLGRLGYPQGNVASTPNSISYHQPGYADFAYDVEVAWQQSGDTLLCAWSIASSIAPDDARMETRRALALGWDSLLNEHAAFWRDYHAASNVSVPDSLIQRQYDNDMYKFGCTARADSYPISLQSIWTADNGRLPPWKGDYHHDLNTQLSYWPAYTSGHAREALGFLNTLWDQRPVYKDYTRTYFEKEGMNVPGVCTLAGQPMGGWIQYAMSQTAGAWLAYHFYDHWRYTADREFLAERAYPFIRDVAVYMEQQSTITPQGTRTLAISSTPEMFDNSPEAWRREITNYDLALMKALFNAASHCAKELGLAEDADRWSECRDQLPPLDTDSLGALSIAPGLPYDKSHRHFSHAMAIHPLGVLSMNATPDRAIAQATVDALDAHGPDYWTGYSYAWLANLKARLGDGEGAARALRAFAHAFCGPNTFHLNGDQTRSGYSRMTYRPFTLEGNFAAAGGLLEMLLQSHDGEISVFPAIPADWRDVSFSRLRARGNVEVSARIEGGELKYVELSSPISQTVRLRLPGRAPIEIDLRRDRPFTLAL